MVEDVKLLKLVHFIKHKHAFLLIEHLLCNAKQLISPLVHGQLVAELFAELNGNLK